MTGQSEHNINIQVETSYVESQSVPEENHYVFSYTITIRNDGGVAARLLNRHWIITDANGNVEEVKGPGVVGQQPVLQPGESFEYTSFCPLTTPFGTMRGTYQMTNENGDSFDAEISEFELSEPLDVN